MKPPKLDIKALAAARRNDGVVLLTVGRSTRAIRKVSEFEAVIAIDRYGEIVWRREFDFCIMDCRRSASDTLLVMGTDGRAVEIGLDGTLLRQWYCSPRFPEGLDGIPLETGKLHHTIAEPEPGRLLSLSVEHLPLECPDGEWTHFMGDTVVLFDRDGRIEQEISLAGILDLRRMCYGSDAPYWANQGWPRTRDWTHGNCAIVDPSDGGILVSLRHQDCVIKIRRDGELAWILGDPNGWREAQAGKLLKIDGGRPFYHQHDLSFTSNGDLMLFDNGTAGAAPPAPEQPIAERRSFALAYAVDERAMTATETWRYGDIPYSHYVSGVCEMPNGNRFIACTGLCHAADGARVEIPPQGVGSIVLKEVSPNGDVVFLAEIRDAAAAPDRGWNGFRPEYLPRELSDRLR